MPTQVENIEKRRATVVLSREVFVKKLGLPLSIQLKKAYLSDSGQELCFDVVHKGLNVLEDENQENPIVSWESSFARPHFQRWNQ